MICSTLLNAIFNENINAPLKQQHFFIGSSLADNTSNLSRQEELSFYLRIPPLIERPSLSGR